MTDNIKNNSTDHLESNALPEDLRRQYLNAMGIQTWFDPALKTLNPVLAEGNVKKVETNQSHKHDVAKPAQAEPVQQKSEQLNASIVETNGVPQVESSQQSLKNSFENLAELNIHISQCELCELHTSRKQVVTGEGSEDAKLFIITDAPVDDTGVENALLDISDKAMLQAMLQTINCSLSTVYISSLVKCRPPERRSPQTSEMICCDDYLSAQIKLVKPSVILVMGELASQQLLVSQKSLTDLRLRQHKHYGIPVYASYHPAEMFNSSETKRKVWADLLQISNHI